MTNLDRLKMELANKEYFADELYTTWLSENGLVASDEYNKEMDQRKLLFTCLDVLESVSNDVDLMRKVETEFATTSQAYSYLEKRIAAIKDKIEEITDKVEEYSCFTLMYTN